MEETVQDKTNVPVIYLASTENAARRYLVAEHALVLSNVLVMYLVSTENVARRYLMAEHA